MRLATLAGLFVFAIIFAANSTAQVSAEALDIIKSDIPTQSQHKAGVLAAAQLPLIDETSAPPEVVKTEPKVHEVVVGDTLSSIGEQNQTTWKRLYDKNEQLADPAVLKVGDKVTIPLADEVLKDRPLPEVPIQPATVPVTTTATAKKAAPRAAKPAAPKMNRGASGGNTYSPGYCTWYAKNKRPDLPNNLGNANTWVSRAAAQGIPTGSAPRAGAIGQQGMHVVYVERVNGDGTVTISEMNYRGLYVISSRTVPAGTFMYIY